MTTHHWIIRERSTRWAAALRTCCDQRPRERAHPPAVHEVRSLPELADQLKTHAHSLVLLEVTQENLEATLTWLATSRPKDAKAVALLDEQDCPSNDHEIMASALREAGALDVIRSPRQILPVLALGELHASSCNDAESCNPGTKASFENWAWSLLPWQDAVRPVR